VAVLDALLNSRAVYHHARSRRIRSRLTGADGATERWAQRFRLILAAPGIGDSVYVFCPPDARTNRLAILEFALKLRC